MNMTKIRSKGAVIILATLLSTTGRAAIYLEDFNTGLNGWSADGGNFQSSGGVSNSGYIQGRRVGFSPNYGEHNTGNAASHTLGNLETVYGKAIQVSYQGIVFQGPVNQPPTQGYFDATFSSFWSKVVAPSISPFQSGWTQVSFQIDTDWTDAEAMANGWVHEFGGTSWSNTLHNVGGQEVFYRLAIQPNSSALFVTGLDDFRMQSLNSTPVAQCQDVIVSADATCSADASIDSGSFDPDGDSITITQSPAGPYPLGTTPVTLTVTDSNGASSTCTANVTAVDTTPPTISNFTITPNILNARAVRLLPVAVHVTSSDTCSATTCRIINVTSSDGPTPLPSGRIEPDWLIRNGQLYLRAYKAPHSISRIYTVTVECTDATGNASTQDTTVTAQ